MERGEDGACADAGEEEAARLPTLNLGPNWVPNCIIFGAPLKSLHFYTYPISLDLEAYPHLYINPPLTQGHPSFGEATP